MTREEQILEEMVEKLGEHFDTVRIFATTAENAEAAAYTTGTGNFYAQMGQIREWLIMQEERAKVKIRSEALNGDDE